MSFRIFLSCCIIQGLWNSITAESALFPSLVRLEAVNETSVPGASSYVDPIGGGALLFDSEATTSTLSKRLALNIPVSNYRSRSGARYFRAHPAFLKCAEKAILLLLQDGKAVEIKRGYITADESTGTLADQYLQAGLGIELGLASGSTGTVEDVAAAILKSCPVIVEREIRDLVVIIKSDKVHAHMSGPTSSGPSVTQDGYSGIGDVTSWAAAKINEGLEPVTTIDCSLYSGLTNGQHHPANFTQDRAVGTLDVKITRDMDVDFKRLVQYQGSNMEFENSEGSAGWCNQLGQPCPTTCTNGIQGNTIGKRCADRVMTQRMLSVLNKLQKKARIDLSDKLLVKEAWDEAYAGQPLGDSDLDPLHYEGRAVKLVLKSGDTSKLSDLSKFAICVGADYVEHRGTYLYVSVKRMQTGGKSVTFPNMQLLAVDVPSTVEDSYSLPAAYTEAERKMYPLFDSSGKLDAQLSAGIAVRQFVSPDYRYFRLNPKLVECYREVKYKENKNKDDGVSAVDIVVTRGFISNNQNKKTFDVIKDKRYNTHNMGLAMQIKYGGNLPATYTPFRLLHTVIDKCAPRFWQDKLEMGVGLYEDGVFVDLRKLFHLMAESLDHLPADVDRNTFEDVIEDRFLMARDKRVVDPDNTTTACLFQTRPRPQSLSFEHTETEITRRKRRRRRSTPDVCVPNRYTSFCSDTLNHRKDVVNEIMSMVDRKHYLIRTRDEILNALEKCLGDCGTCMEGEIWDSKTEHCNNFIHWVDFTLMNTEPDITNFFVRSNKVTNLHACEHGEDCLERAPLFSLLITSIEKVYRPDPTKSVEEELYSATNNPTPLLTLMSDMYGIQARGVVKFWVKDDTEMTALIRPLEVVMLYNRNVTKIEIYVTRYTIAKDAVRGVVEKAAQNFVTMGCPAVTRATLTPYEILEVPPDKVRRAAEPQSLRHQVREYHRNYEARWAAKNIYL